MFFLKTLVQKIKTHRLQNTSILFSSNIVSEINANIACMGDDHRGKYDHLADDGTL